MTQNAKRPVLVISPNTRHQEGVVGAMRQLLLALVRNRSQISSLFMAQWRSISRGAGLGWLWNYLLPIIPLSVYVLLAKVKVLPSFQGLDPAAAITLNVTLWFLLTGFVQVPISTVSTKRGESLKTSFPLICSTAAAYAQLVFDTMIRLICTMIVCLLGAASVGIEALAVPILLLPALFLFGSVGLLLSVLNAIYVDVSRVVGIVLQYGVFLSGVIFPVDGIAVLHEINRFNPFAVFIDASRSLVFSGELVVSNELVGFTALSLVLLPIASKVFYVMEERIRD